jgi:hypothetical protein
MIGRHTPGGPVPVRALDHGFVAARPERVFDVLSDPAGYPAWWPGARTVGDGRVRLPGLPPLRMATDGVRPGTGLFVRVSDGPGGGFEGEIGGHMEWYLEAFEEGTVVSCITDLRAACAWRPRRVLRVRAGVRSAMVALKGMLE